MEFPPIAFCRIILNTVYDNFSKSEITEMLRNYNLIPDNFLALNVAQCMFNDHQEGALIDASRRCIGEEYEIRLKQMARSAGITFYDEGDLRREGYDKTPDLKLAVPCLYRGRIVHWIESKALFGDLDSHQKYLHDQLLSYGNRFGNGIVIYWLGYLDEINNCKENGDFLTILDRFPDQVDLEFIQFDDLTE